MTKPYGYVRADGQGIFIYGEHQFQNTQGVELIPVYTTPPQPKEPEQEPKCNPHPEAPHGFNRNASHANDRYTCECEGWDAYDAGYQAGVLAGIEASMGQEPEQEPDGHFLDFAYADSIAQVYVYDQFQKGQQFYTTPPQRKQPDAKDFEDYCKTLRPLWNTRISRTEAEGFFHAGWLAAHGIKEKNT